MIRFVVLCFATFAFANADFGVSIVKIENDLLLINQTIYSKYTTVLSDEKALLKKYMDQANNQTTFLCVLNATLHYTNTYMVPLLDSWTDFESNKVTAAFKSVLQLTSFTSTTIEPLVLKVAQIKKEVDSDFTLWQNDIAKVKATYIRQHQDCVGYYY